MYKLVLISKYLRRKIAPMFAALAVTLCTMMVIIVISVMGGFLDLLRTSVQRVTGDVIVDAGSYTGFPRYEQLIERLMKLPEVEHATPIVRAYGLMQLYDQTLTVMVQGIRPGEFDQVVGYRDALYWSRQDLIDVLAKQPGEQIPDELREKQAESLMGMDLVGWAMTLQPPPERKKLADLPDLAGAVPGIEVNPFNRRDDLGRYNIDGSLIFTDVTLTVVPVSERGEFLSPSVRRFAVLNEFKSGLFDIDANTMFVPFDVLQKMLSMQKEEGQDFDDEGNPLPGTFMTPGRATEVTLRAAPGYSADAAANAVGAVVADFTERYPDLPRLRVRTWEQRHMQLLNAVKNEKGLVTFLFAFISLVAIVFVAVTFWLIVLSKTRDIGVLRAMGASRMGILILFVGYGLVIGVLGASAGLGLGWLQVRSLNATQAFLGNYLGVTVHLLGSAVAGAMLGVIAGVLIGFVRRSMVYWVVRLMPACAMLLFVPSIVAVFAINGYWYWLNAHIRFQMWDPQTYYFDRIPDQVNFGEVLFIVLGAVGSSVLGAVIPALMASSCEPIESLRYE